MQNTLALLGLVVAGTQLVVTAIAAFYVSLQLRTMKEQTKSLAQQAGNMADQTRLLKEEQVTMVKMERQKKSFEYIHRFNEAEMVKLRHEAVVAMQKQGKLIDEDVHSLLAYLNFYEEMAIAILSELASEALCEQYFRQILLNTYAASEDVFKENPGRYSALHKLHQRWQ